MVAAILDKKHAGDADVRSATTTATARSASSDFIRTVFRFAPRRHFLLVGLAVASAPVLYLTLELPKWIVNGALQGGDFDCLSMGLPATTALIVLTLAQLAALSCLSGLKFASNVLAANLGERFLRAQRLRLMKNWRRRPTAGRDKTIAPMLTQELEAVAGFAGGMIATPVAQGVALLAVLGFLLAQDWRLALAAVALTPVQALLAPHLMRPIGVLKATRIDVLRGMCAEVSEPEAPRVASALMEARRAQNLRFEIHRRKFLLKALYNMIGHVTPLLYLSVGGYLVIEGALSLGALVAALAAYREAAGPLRELFALYMRWADARIRFCALRQAIS